MSQRACETDVSLAVLEEFLLCIDFPDIDLREPTMGTESNELAAGRDLDVLDPGVFLACLGRLCSAEHLESASVQDLDLTVPVADG